LRAQVAAADQPLELRVHADTQRLVGPAHGLLERAVARIRGAGF